MSFGRVHTYEDTYDSEDNVVDKTEFWRASGSHGERQFLPVSSELISSCSCH